MKLGEIIHLLKTKLGIAIVLLLILSVFQIYTSTDSYILPISRRILEMLGKPAWERAALILEDEKFAGHIKFLREVVPEDARVILPPVTLYTSYEHIGFMQYFLIPRDLHNCGHSETPEECVLRMDGASTYIVGLRKFPPREEALTLKKYIEYDGDLGVFAPK
jgi:hypothetical protein